MKINPTKPKLVAELGINHNGSFETLIEMTDKAFDSGADYVKLQLRTPEICVPEDQWNIPRKWFDGNEIPYIEYKKRMEFSDEELFVFDDYVRYKHGGNWFASVWDIPSAKRYFEYQRKWVKIPSAKITDMGLLDYINKNYYNAIISTGMSTTRQVKNAISKLDSMCALVVMACHSSYPTPQHEEDFNKMETLRQMLTGGLDEVGYSSHATNPFIPIYSIFGGAQWIEVHFTLNRAMPGSDHAASLEPSGLKLLTRELERIPQLFGDGELYIRDSELPALKKLRGIHE